MLEEFYHIDEETKIEFLEICLGNECKQVGKPL